MKTYCIISVLVFWWSLQLPGQVDVQGGGNFSDDEWLATEVLSSEGVFVSNVRSYGYEEQFGYFSSGQEILGMPSGVMMTNGSVSTLNQGMTTQQTELDVTPLGGEGDDDLLDVANEVPDLINESFTVSVTHDAAILEFDGGFRTHEAERLAMRELKSQ